MLGGGRGNSFFLICPHVPYIFYIEEDENTDEICSFYIAYIGLLVVDKIKKQLLGLTQSNIHTLL